MKRFWLRVGSAGLLFVFLSVFAGDKVRWGTDVRSAMKQAAKENRWLVIEFTGLDWCAPCMALRDNALKTPEFEAFAKGHLVLVELDFPKRRPQSPGQQAHNATYQRKFNVDGFPTLLVLRPDGSEATRWVGYRGQTGASLVEDIKALQTPTTSSPPTAQPPLAAK